MFETIDVSPRLFVHLVGEKKTAELLREAWDKGKWVRGEIYLDFDTENEAYIVAFTPRNFNRYLKIFMKKYPEIFAI